MALTPLFMLPGGPEMFIILAIVVLLFGANKLPALARSSGQAMGEFQKGRNEIEDELRAATAIDDTATTGSGNTQNETRPEKRSEQEQ
jgi:sec-independent protein translocase protein TatA